MRRTSDTAGIRDEDNICINAGFMFQNPPTRRLWNGGRLVVSWDPHLRDDLPVNAHIDR